MKGQFDLVVVEGDLEAAVAERLLSDRGHPLFPGLILNKRGQAAFWSDAPRFNQAAQHLKILGLVDLEQHRCPSDVLRKKLKRERHPNFVLRIAVRMVESWLLADLRLADEFSIPREKLPVHPDRERHGKKLLIELVRRYSPRSVQTGFLPGARQHGLTGYDYETRLARFVAQKWVPADAAKRSPSLERALLAIDLIVGG